MQNINQGNRGIIFVVLLQPSVQQKESTQGTQERKRFSGYKNEI